MKPGNLPVRRWIQLLFLIIVIAIGIQFGLFVSHIEKGMIPDFSRPPGVEAFLPISAVISLKYFICTGIINQVHPSGLVIFILICLTALFAKKGFCSWICPIGLLSETFRKLHNTLFKRKMNLPHILDVILRSLKYLLAGFFIYQIFFKMPLPAIEQFIFSPYNQFADIKMLKFFTDISMTAFIILVVLILLSVIIKDFWCRYLCPYGAVLSILGFLSIGKIHRDPESCTKCGKCETRCPGLIRITRKRQINSAECTACLTCVDNCPEKAVRFSFILNKLPVRSVVLASVFLFLFGIGITTARVTGHWHNAVPKEAYVRYAAPVKKMPFSDMQIDPEKMKRMMRMMELLKQQELQKKQPKSPMTN